MRVEIINAHDAVQWQPGKDAPGVYLHEGWPEPRNTDQGSFCVDFERDGNRVEPFRLNPGDWIVYDVYGHVQSVTRRYY